VVVGTTSSVPSATATVNQFLGIPFGVIPVRFHLPKPAQPWATPYDASKYGPPYIQKFNYPEAMRNRTLMLNDYPPPPVEDSEDCLNLNIYTPDTEGPKAVLFWIFGGGFSFGTGSLPLYDGLSLAANHDVVVVTSNHRTNVFGFPGSPEIPESKQNLAYVFRAGSSSHSF
jgi:carboxylesterase 3/5